MPCWIQHHFCLNSDGCFFGRQNLMVVSFSSFKVSQHMSTYPLFGSISFDDFSSLFVLHLWEISLLCFLVDEIIEIYESIFRVNKLPCPTVIPHPITEDRLFQVLRESSTRFTSIDEAALPWNITWYNLSNLIWAVFKTFQIPWWLIVEGDFIN
jgi:hypothetical protein